MKKILITGANSYIGTCFEKWIMQWPKVYHVETIDLCDDSWREKKFKGYVIIFHVAGIVHRKESAELEKLYFNVNCSLVVEVVSKAKEMRISQFIFMNTKGVYKPNTPLIITETKENSEKLHGKSKLRAEMKLSRLQCKDFVYRF
jgi:UDP-glucose 4-epimerase